MGEHNVHKEIKTNVCLWLKIEKSALSSAGSELYLVSPPCPSISRIRCLLSGCQQDTVLLSILQVQAQTGFSMNYNACRNTSASHSMLEAVFESFSMNKFVHVTTSSAGRCGLSTQTPFSCRTVNSERHAEEKVGKGNSPPPTEAQE